MVEHLSCKEKVLSSILRGGIFFCRLLLRMAESAVVQIQNVYNECIGIYNSKGSKEENKRIILDLLAKTFAGPADDHLFLKVLMETQFMRDVDCDYTYLFTPDKYGCDLRELVFNIETEANRTGLLASIKNTSHPEASIPHILTDIDDTLYPNFHGFIETMGSDTSWKTQEPYPGIKKFYEIFHHNISLQAAKYSTVLTGTPVFLKKHRLASTRLINILGPNFGFIQGFDKKRQAIQALLKGFYEHSFYKLAVSSEYIANIKLEKFTQYKQLFPEYKLLFIGDNGQGDLIAGKRMIETDPNCQVFIHNILKRATAFRFSDAEEQAELAGTQGRLFFFKNYLELGDIFRALGYFSDKNFADLRDSTSFDIRQGLVPLCASKLELCKEKNLFFHYTCPIQKPEVCLTLAAIKQAGGKTRKRKRQKYRRQTRKNIAIIK
jgi:hypothetical protein